MNHYEITTIASLLNDAAVQGAGLVALPALAGREAVPDAPPVRRQARQD